MSKSGFQKNFSVGCNTSNSFFVIFLQKKREHVLLSDHEFHSFQNDLCLNVCEINKKVINFPTFFSTDVIVSCKNIATVWYASKF